MKRTSALDLIIAFGVFGVLVYLLLRLYYDTIPPLHYQVALPIAGLAIGELIAAHRFG